MVENLNSCFFRNLEFLGERFPDTSNYTTWQALWTWRNNKKQPLLSCRLRSRHPTEESTCSPTSCSLVFQHLTCYELCLALAVQDEAAGCQSALGALYLGWHRVNNPWDPSPERDLFFKMKYNNHGLKYTLFYIQLRKEMALLGIFLKQTFRETVLSEFDESVIYALTRFCHSSLPQKTALCSAPLHSCQRTKGKTLLLPELTSSSETSQHTEITLNTGQWGLVQTGPCAEEPASKEWPLAVSWETKHDFL